MAAPGGPGGPLAGRAQIDVLRILAALARKYGGPEAVLELSPADLAPVRGGLEREVDEEAGVLRFRFRRAPQPATGGESG